MLFILHGLFSLHQKIQNYGGAKKLEESNLPRTQIEIEPKNKLIKSIILIWFLFYIYLGFDFDLNLQNIKTVILVNQSKIKKKTNIILK